MAEQQHSPEWERNLIEKMALSSAKAEKSRRRWGYFFKFLLFAYLFSFLALAMPWKKILKQVDGHTAVIEIKGVIADNSQASADRIISSLRAAYEDENTKGIILKINTPGGSPVQSAYVNSEMIRLKKKYPKIPLYAVVTDMCASGGYYIAVAADKIFVNENSIVGSIGVLFNSFGAVEVMKKIGIERRLITAGSHKGMLDPFSPLGEFEKAHLKTMLEQLHQNFIKVVKEGRGTRLKETDDMFSGLFWSGTESIKLGLADDINTTSNVARDIIGVENIVDFTQHEDVIEKIAKKIGASMGAVLLQAMPIEARVKM